ncbi:MAG: hypothetical protein KME05_18135 [Gloeocapsa sp. UFS-A4-WI-NPMV-4B04]|nr:hypothetical protein [Gloeocapsa sp. UFS-A4-WI-NPMV-4B04]
MSKPNSLISQTATPSPSVVPDPLDNVKLEALDAKILEVVQRFVNLDPNTHLATFDVKAAKGAGYDSHLIQLVKEQISFQNELVEAKKYGTRMGEIRPSALKYPKFKKFEDRATAKAKETKIEFISTPSVTEYFASKTVKLAGVNLGKKLLAVKLQLLVEPMLILNLIEHLQVFL